MKTAIIRNFSIVSAVALLAACQSAEQTAGTATGAAAGAAVAGPVGAAVGAAAGAAATAQPGNQFVGTYTGRTAAGGDIRIVVPATGRASYVFRGEAVPVASTQISGDRMILRVGRSGGGTIILTPVSPGRLQYDYTFMDQRASAILVRA